MGLMVGMSKWFVVTQQVVNLKVWLSTFSLPPSLEEGSRFGST